MRRPLIALSFATMLLAGAAALSMPAAQDAPMAAAVAASTRSPANIARDKYRHPAETLAFFGVKPTDSVVEIWPGGGWYTEILAPYLSARGKLTVVSPPGRQADSIAARLDADAATYGKVARATFPSALGGMGVAPGSVDKVLTFRNVHNWRMGYLRPDKLDYSAAAFQEIYAMLKPGGVLGIEDHRLPESADPERERSSGYIKVSTIRALAEGAGFTLAGESEVNANPLDTHDWPKGVWTLPPSYDLGDKDREKYAAIGESDRMTLRFVKPAK
jgi:predicted methyltransferase